MKVVTLVYEVDETDPELVDALKEHHDNLEELLKDPNWAGYLAAGEISTLLSVKVE